MVRWTWWDWSLSLELLLPSVIWPCWLGHLTHKNPSPIWPIMCLVGCWTLLNQSPTEIAPVLQKCSAFWVCTTFWVSIFEPSAGVHSVEGIVFWWCCSACFLVPSSECRHKGIADHPFHHKSSCGWRRDEARPWLGLMLYVTFSVLTLMVGWQEERPSHDNLFH